MVASFPSDVKSFGRKTDNVDDVMADDVNFAYDEIEALETELGTDPAGAYATVKARLDANDTAVGLNTTHRTSAGTDHSDVGLNNTHRTSNGSDHSYLNQAVTTTSDVTFDDLTLTGTASVTGRVGIGVAPDASDKVKIQPASRSNMGVMVTDTDGSDAIGLYVNSSGEGGLYVYDASGTLKSYITASGTSQITGDLNISEELKFDDGEAINDDAATSFSVDCDNGIIFLYQAGGADFYGGMVAFRATSAPFARIITAGAGGAIEVTTGALAGTTGTNGKFTVGVADGTIYLENRLGAATLVYYFVIGRY
jgi:hypothetical protein